MKSLNALRVELKSKFPEREAVVDGMLTALIAGEHAFLLGPPGTGKSMISRALSKAISASYREILLTKFTTPEELFGPLNLKALQEGRYERNLHHTFVDTQIGFVDEIFKGSSAILNTMLTLSNERIFVNGSQGVVKSPLISLFGASNEIPQGEELAALYDRFALRFIVNRIEKDVNMESILFGDQAGKQLEIQARLDLAQLEMLQAVARAMPFSPEAQAALIEIRKLLQADNHYVSDRKWVQAIKILKAYAELQGEAMVKKEHLVLLRDICWTHPESRPAITEIVLSIANPVLKEVESLVDGAHELIKNGATTETISKMKVILNKLGKLQKDQPDNTQIQDAVAQVTVMQKKAAASALGVEL